MTDDELTMCIAGVAQQVARGELQDGTLILAALEREQNTRIKPEALPVAQPAPQLVAQGQPPPLMPDLNSPEMLKFDEYLVDAQLALYGPQFEGVTVLSAAFKAIS